MVMPGLYQIWTRITPSIDHSCVKRRDPWEVRHYVNYLIYDRANTCQRYLNLNTEAHFEFWKYNLFCLKKHKDICVLWSCKGPTCRNRKRKGLVNILIRKMRPPSTRPPPPDGQQIGATLGDPRLHHWPARHKLLRFWHLFYVPLVEFDAASKLPQFWRMSQSFWIEQIYPQRAASEV